MNMSGENKALVLVVFFVCLTALLIITSSQRYMVAQEQQRNEAILAAVKEVHDPVLARCMMEPLQYGQTSDTCKAAMDRVKR